MARSQYRLPTETTGKSDRGDPRGLSGYIRETAAKYGVDPEVALKVAKSEGLRDFSGDGGKSGGAFQLYTGGGLGNQFRKETGLDPLDPANEKATIDYALKHASQHGWGPWHGAPKVGVGEWDGIGGGGAKTASTDAAAGYGGVGSDAAASERAATAGDTVAGAHTATTTPDVTSQTATGPATGDWLDKLKDPRTGAGTGLSEAISGLGQAVTGSSTKGLYDTAPARTPVPVAMPAAPRMVPMVDPQLANQQRQQLALAMQRLNSGRLV